jgi:predicted P-loop ATPase
MLIVEGKQRCGKSLALSKLLPNPDWFVTLGGRYGDKDFRMVINQKLIAEWAEISGLQDNIARIKAMITTQVDTYRRPYASEVTDQGRSCVFVGSTNDGEYLQDETGGGRFLPVMTSADQIENPINIENIIRDRDQLWGEAVFRYKKGEKWHFDDPTLIRMAMKEQEDRRQQDPWETTFQELLWDEEKCSQGVTIRDILQWGNLSQERELTKAVMMRASKCLTAIGWKRGVRIRKDGHRDRVFQPPIDWVWSQKQAKDGRLKVVRG